MKLVLLPKEQVIHVWPLVLPDVRSYTDRSYGRYNTDDVLEKINSGEIELWIIIF